MSVTKRLSRGLSASGYYSWSKTLSDVPIQGANPAGNTPVQDVNNLAAERSRASFDLRDQAVLSLIYQPTVAVESRIVRGIVNGWELVPLARLRTGGPFSVLNGVEANLDGSSGERANLIGNPFSGTRTRAKWFNTTAFAQLPAVAGNPVDGNSPPNFISAPAYHSLDLTLARTFPIHENINFQFRAEGSNVLNVLSFMTPGNTVNSATFGVITSANPMRQIQLGAKLNF